MIFVLCWLAFYLVRGAVMAFWFDGAPGNGPFQIYNPLRRIAAGQVPGLDFVFYHGIGVPYLHYPIFALFGAASITASEISRQWTSALAFLISLGSFFYLLLGRSRWVWVALASALLAIEAVYPIAAEPGLSQVGLRATMPLFAFAALLLPVSRRAQALLAGAFMGLALPFGTEHGIALTLALTAVSAVSILWPLAARRDTATALANAAFFVTAMLAAAFAAGAAFLMLAGVDGAKAALHYALVDLPADKFWFDGSPPNPYLGSWWDFVESPRKFRVVLPAIAALALLIGIWRRFRSTGMRLGRDWEALAVLMLTYGILSCIAVLGVYSKHYVLPLVRVLAMVGVFLTFHLLTQRAALASKMTAKLGVAAFSAVCVIAAAGLAFSTADRIYRFVQYRQTGSFAYSPNMSGPWNAFMHHSTALIDANTKGGKPNLWSVYAGQLASHYGIFPAAEDYMVLSAGRGRFARYVDKFRLQQPEVVETMAAGFPYEEWLQNTRWHFYEELLANYDFLQRVGHAQFWKRKPGPWAATPGVFEPVPLDPGANSVKLASSNREDQLGVLRIHYSVHNPWTRLPVLGLTPRYMAMISGTPRNCSVSFPPYLTYYDFPVRLPASGEARIDFVTRTLLPGAAYRVNRVELKRLPYRASHQHILSPL